MEKKSRSILVMIGFAICTIVVVLSGSMGSAIAQPPSYELVCKGGGDMVAQVKAYRGEHVIGVNFRKARQGAGAAMPGPGECAWVDRPLNDREPTTVSYRTTSEGYLYVEVHPGRIDVGDAQPRFVRAMIDAIHRSQVFRVMCYNDGRMLQVTGAPGSRK